MNLQTDRQFVPAHGTVVRHILIQVTAPGRSRQAERPPAGVALVLDRSGSMAGRKIKVARKAVDHAVRLLGSQDHLAVVSFDTEVDTVLGATLATAEAKALAKQRLGEIDARGGTDLHAGWTRGAGELLDRAPAGNVRRVLLLTDGQANEGETNPDTLAAYAASLHASGVQTTTFGVGHDFDEVLLARLSREGGGNFYYVEAPEQIPDFFASELGETLEVVARNAEVVVTGGPGVRVACLHDFPTRVDERGLHIRLGDLVAEQEITVLVAIEFDGNNGALQNQRALRTEVRLADRDNVLFSGPMPVEWPVVDAETDRNQPVSVPVLIEVATLIASRANAAALAANRAGYYDRARAIVDEAAAAIRGLVYLGLENQPELRQPELRAVLRIADELAGTEDIFCASIGVHEMKKMHYEATNVMRSRSSRGTAKRQSRA